MEENKNSGEAPPSSPQPGSLTEQDQNYLEYGPGTPTAATWSLTDEATIFYTVKADHLMRNRVGLPGESGLGGAAQVREPCSLENEIHPLFGNRKRPLDGNPMGSDAPGLAAGDQTPAVV